MKTEPKRYAIYFAPLPDTQAWARGSQWLGRCAAQQLPLTAPVSLGLSADDFARLTQAPRRYGWHATLKAPFALAPGVSLSDLRCRLRALATSLPAFDLPPLVVQRLDDFLALVPNEEDPRIRQVADACVRELQALAAPLSPAQIQRRRAAQLSAAQDALMLRWGYPYVFDEFRWHCSLTGNLRGESDATVQAVEDAARAWFAPVAMQRMASLALFAESAEGADFVLIEHMALS